MNMLVCSHPSRLQRRIDRLLSPVSAEWPGGLTLANSWRRLDTGGVDDIGQWIENATDPRLVVLDTLAGVKPIKTQQGYTEDYESLAALHRAANERGVSIVVLHHTRKMEADDPVDTISGTLGLSGCADSLLVLNRTSRGTTLYVRGRDIEEAEHAVTFDKHRCRWTILGTAAEVHRSNERGKILGVGVVSTEWRPLADMAIKYRLPAASSTRAGSQSQTTTNKIYSGDRVTFDLAPDPFKPGKMRAVAVRLVNGDGTK